MIRQEEWKEYKNILCIRPDNIGDILMTTPALRALKESVPGRRLTLLASKAGSTIAKFIPEIDDVIIFETPWEKNDYVSSDGMIPKTLEEIKSKKFDAAVIFNVYSQSSLPAAMLCYMAGIARVAGYCRENPYKLISDWIPDREPLKEIKHEVQRQLTLVSNLGATTNDESLSLRINKTDDELMIDKLKKVGINMDAKSVIVHPGVSEPKRQFSVDSFAKAAKMMVEELDYQVILTGLKSEKNLTERIASISKERTFDIAGELSMGEFIALIKRAYVLVSNNTGPVHIAAAVQTPVVVLYALTNPQHAPWNVAHKILPFEIPANMQSRNIIINYANEKSFRKTVPPVSAENIVAAVKQLTSSKKTNRTGLIYT
jgi:lipopolysaccharide heptosyltransferase II